MRARERYSGVVLILFLLGANAVPSAGPSLAAQDGQGSAEAMHSTDSCACERHADPSGDGIACDVFDVILTIDVAFSGAPPIPDPNLTCPYLTTDVDCSGATDVFDVIKVIQVAFGVSTPAMEFCTPCGPIGRLIGSTDCKAHPVANGAESAPAGGTPPDQDCLEYEYDGVSILLLKHVNAGFNCCPDSFAAEFHLAGDTIAIGETEWLTHPCMCLCLFDLDYEIVNLPPRHYTIKIKEPYLWEGAQVLEFTVDLSSSPSGNYCVYRDRYPWGIR